ncbi:hypothetical protein [Pragia fontium]|uniref:Uncharacterized protein n=1 Tax=Pragia fontium DSM 5563 = ATCC 49100 TaxID=1122977 RepID=A0AAJ4W9G0_9GAMM|nr:hypothetical protein [Pragia fontium]SFC48929.1 hypothetical protein SAMN02745723_102491 [Pragia fontium DSM 5563 = ATCC 49100]
MSQVKLKPFDLEAAKRGEPVIQRNGLPATIIFFDSKIEVLGSPYPIIALITSNDGLEEIGSFNLKGLYLALGPTNYDLFMAPKKRAGYLNIYPVNHPLSDVWRRFAFYETKADADTAADPHRINCIPVEWEE